MRTRRAVRSGVPGAVLAGMLALAACRTGDDRDAVPVRTTPAAAAPTAVRSPQRRPVAAVSAQTFGLTATLEQYREDEVAHRLQLKVENHGDRTVRIATLQLDWPGLTLVAPAPLDYPVGAGGRVDLAVPYGDAVCSTPPRVDEPTPNEAIAGVATVEPGPDAPSDPVVFPVTDPRGVLARIHPADCRRQAVEDVAMIRFAPQWTVISSTPPTMTGELVITRRRPGPSVRVDVVAGSVLLRPVATGLPAELTAPQPEIRIPVTIVNNRCDAHALSEVKKPYVFDLTVALDGVAVGYTLQPDDAGKVALRAGIIDRCPPDAVP